MFLVFSRLVCLNRSQCTQLLTPSAELNDVSSCSVTNWLESIKMERYIEQFISSGITSLDDVSLLTLQDLVSLGVTLVGHQKKIMNSVQTLRAQRQQTADDIEQQTTEYHVT